MHPKRLDKWTITDKAQIRKAISAPICMPDSFIRTLVPIGMAKYKGGEPTKGDFFDPSISFNNYFTKGVLYPIYNEETDYMIVGNDGIGYKIVKGFWGNIIFF